MKKTITIGKNDKFFIKVYHIGYSSQGESCVFILYTGDKRVVYSLVIDCYEEDQCNITDEILKKWKLENGLDMLIWTHAHDDHSIGIKKIIEKYCSKETIICTENLSQAFSGCSEICCENINYIVGLNHRKRVKNKRMINPYAHFAEVLDEIYFNGETDIKNIVVICIAPFPELSGMQMGHINHNLSGIACILEVQMEYGNINFLFAGDMEKYTVERLICNYDDYNYIIPNVYNYIKIPHHGSEDAYNLIKLFGEERSEFASTSVFVNKKLPRKKVIDGYKNVVEYVACTSDISTPNYGKGVVCLEFDLQTRKNKRTLYGTAVYL
jgi:hypothetical protein